MNRALVWWIVNWLICAMDIWAAVVWQDHFPQAAILMWASGMVFAIGLVWAQRYWMGGYE